jgi:hypothetical protein
MFRSLWSPTSSPKSKAKCLGPRFSYYFNGLQEEFELQCNATSAKSTGPHRFNIYLEALKCEFEAMAENLESLQTERDEFQVKGMYFGFLS